MSSGRADEAADRDVFGAQLLVGAVGHDGHALDPGGRAEQLCRAGAEAAVLGGPQVAQQDDGGDGQQGHGADEGAADDAVLREPGLLLAALVLIGRLDVFVLGRLQRVTLLHDLDVGHELLGPLDGASADAEDAQAEREPQDEVLRADLAEHRDVDAGRGVDGDVADAEEDEHEHRDQEEARDLALGAARGLGIDVAAARTVGDVGGRQSTGALVERTRQIVGVDAVGYAVAVIGSGAAIARGDLAHRALIAIHTARPTKTAKTPAQRNRPSVTGPRRPSARPPGLSDFCRSMM